MRTYDFREGATHCRAFLDAKSQSELLIAVSTWWADKEPIPSTIIEGMQFLFDGDDYGCHVFWVSFPPDFDFEAEVEKLTKVEHEDPLGLPPL